MIPLAAIQAGVGIIGGGIQAVLARQQQKKLQKQLDAMVRPEYHASPYERQMLNLAEANAGRGISDASRTAYMNDAQSGLASTISAIQKGGGDANALGNAYGQYGRGINQLAIYDDQARSRNMANVMNAWARQSANDDKAFMFNQYAPYADKRAALTQQLAGATNMFNSGLNTAMGGGAGLGSLLGGLGGGGSASGGQAAGGDASGGQMSTPIPSMVGVPEYTVADSGGPYAGGFQPDFSGYQSPYPGVTSEYPIGGSTNVPARTQNAWGWSTPQPII